MSNLGLDKLLDDLSSGGRNREVAIKTIYYTYKNYLFKVIDKFDDEDKKHDIYQETILSFLKNFDERKYDRKANLEVYLAAIAKNKTIDEYRKTTTRKKYEKNSSTEIGSSRIQSHSNSLVGKERFSALKSFLKLAQLGEKCISLLVNDAMGYKNEELAIMLDLDNKNVANKKYRCIKKLTKFTYNNPDLCQKFKAWLQ